MNAPSTNCGRMQRRPFLVKQPGWSTLLVVALVVSPLTDTTSSVRSAEAFFPEAQCGWSWGRRQTMTTTMSQSSSDASFSGSLPDDSSDSGKSDWKKGKRRIGKRRRLLPSDIAADEAISESNCTSPQTELLERVSQLEQLVSSQAVEIKRLKAECNDLIEAAAAFARVIEMLREAGLQTEETDQASAASSIFSNKIREKDDSSPNDSAVVPVVEASDNSEIFGRVPSSILDAADSAGAAILAGMLGGKQRMLVDVRDAELSDTETLVQFIELSILPVAAGLEGLKSTRNRLKIIFPTVSQLLDYRRTMALAAPEVVALSTLGLDPIEKHDNLVVLVAPPPTDKEGVAAMNELLEPSSQERKSIEQPVVVLNYHMGPIQGPAASFEVAYHLRLLSVSYASMSSAKPQDDNFQDHSLRSEGTSLNATAALPSGSGPLARPPKEDTLTDNNNTSTLADVANIETAEDEPLETALKHAQKLSGIHHQTGALIIRAYPNPWHVFVDASPDTDADFEVAATFDQVPTLDDVHLAIREFLVGSEQEDEIVAQQMQEALETGQLDRISEVLDDMGVDFSDIDEDDDDLYGGFGLYNEDSV